MHRVGSLYWKGVLHLIKRQLLGRWGTEGPSDNSERQNGFFCFIWYTSLKIAFTGYFSEQLGNSNKWCLCISLKISYGKCKWRLESAIQWEHWWIIQRYRVYSLGWIRFLLFFYKVCKLNWIEKINFKVTVGLRTLQKKLNVFLLHNCVSLPIFVLWSNKLGIGL